MSLFLNILCFVIPAVYFERNKNKFYALKKHRFRRNCLVVMIGCIIGGFSSWFFGMTWVIARKPIEGEEALVFLSVAGIAAFFAFIITFFVEYFQNLLSKKL